MPVGYIYFVKSENDLIKIGITNDLMSRVCELQTGSPTKVRLEGYIEVDINKMRSEEKRMHERFDEYRRHGEWFECVDEICKYVRDNCNIKCEFINHMISMLYESPRAYRKIAADDGNLRCATFTENRRAEMETNAMKLLSIVKSTGDGATSSELATEFKCTKNLCISMLKILESKNLITTQRRGQKIVYYPIESKSRLDAFRSSFKNGVVRMRPTERETISSPESQYDADPARPLLLLYKA